MNSQTELLERLGRLAGALTLTERQLAAHLVEHLEDWGYRSSSELAAVLGVHRSTIVRFAQHAGYAGFPELQEAARAAYLHAVAESRDLFLSDVGQGDAGTAVRDVYQKELLNIQRSYGHLDSEALEATAQELAAAERVVVFGRRFSYPIALHIGMMLRTVRPGVETSPASGGSSVDQLFDLDSSDFVLAVSLRRHSPEVQRTLGFLAGAAVPVTVLTDASPGDNVPA